MNFKKSWLYAYLVPSGVWEQIAENVTFDGSLSFSAREWLWMPYAVANIIIYAVYAFLLIVTVGIPLRFIFVTRALIRSKRKP